MNAVTTAQAAAALWVALHLLLLLVLSVLVVRQRRRHAVAFGDGGVPELAQAIRAFRSASEYVPAGLIGLVMLAVVGAPGFAVHAAGLVLFGGRVLNAVGLSRSAETSWAGSVGASATWLAYIFLAAALMVWAIV